ncbi:MAG: ATP-dependent Clp protease ATP-binding subunit [Firmicutes bacterium]|nr:ATP-dependent Clp protease ATP-binding subunit [Bacillota bacterium]
MFNNFGFIGSKILKTAEEERYNMHHPYVGSEHLLLAILKSNSDLKKKLNEYNLTYKKFKDELIRIVGVPKKNIEVNLYTPLLKRIISNALDDAKENNKGEVTPNHLLIAMLDEGEGIAIRIMIGLDIDIDSLYDELKIKPNDIAKDKLEIFNVGTILNNKVDNDEKVIGRNSEINNLIEVLLRKKKSNPLLVGPAGVGKTAIVEELARRIKNKEVPTILENKIIVDLPMGDLVSGTKYRGEFEERLTKIIKEVIKNKNIILFIDEVHTMVNAGGAEGAINAGDILKPYLARGDIHVIGATTIKEYEKFIAKDKALERRFELIQVKEPNLEETKDILLGIKKSYEHHHGIKISNKNIEDICNLSNKYLYSKKNPDKTIDLLDSICAYIKRKNTSNEEIKIINDNLIQLTKEKENYVKNNEYEKALDVCLKINDLESQGKNIKNTKKDIITYNDILKVIEQKSNIPMFNNKDELIYKISNSLKTNIYSETKAINKIINNLKTYFNTESNLKLLLLGPSGVGKTSSVKLISKELKNNLIRLDMSEYNLETSVNKLIGVSHGYIGYDDEYIFKKVSYNPYSIILVDEIEKAHPSVLNLFLTIMDEGFITDAHGEIIDFSHTLIFMTSNAIKNNSVGFTNNENNLTENFSEEFLGRFDDIIYFDTLTKEEVLNYLKEKINNNTIDYESILNEINYQKYGFRNINRVINKYKVKINN